MLFWPNTSIGVSQSADSSGQFCSHFNFIMSLHIIYKINFMSIVMCFTFNEFKGSMCIGIISYVLFQSSDQSFNLSSLFTWFRLVSLYKMLNFIKHHLVYFQFHTPVLSEPFWHRSIPVYCKSDCELISSDNTFIHDSNQCITNGERTNYVNFPTAGMQHTTGCLPLCMTQKTIQSDRSLHCF